MTLLLESVNVSQNILTNYRVQSTCEVWVKKRHIQALMLMFTLTRFKVFKEESKGCSEILTDDPGCCVHCCDTKKLLDYFFSEQKRQTKNHKTKHKQNNKKPHLTKNLTTAFLVAACRMWSNSMRN